jgi:HlyD family secretion protein
MDTPIPPEAWQRRNHRLWLFSFAVVLLLVVLTTVGLARLKPAGPILGRSSVRIDTVEQGEMLFQVRGHGTLLPEDVRWIPTMSAEVIERILVLPGAAVQPDTILVELSNPELAQDAFETKSQLKAAQLDLTNLQVQLDSEKLTRQATVVTAQADYTTAKAESDTDDALGRIGLETALSVKEANTKTAELAQLLKIEQKRLKISGVATTVQLAAQQEKIAQLTGLLDLQQQQIAGLKIRAGMAGVLQQLGDTATPLQVGQRLSAGAPVALVASQTKLEAVIQIEGTQARDIQLDQPAEIDTHSGIVPGRVICVDPAWENGTATVDVALTGPLPDGARPGAGVDGAIQLERLPKALHVGRPVQGQPNSVVGLFKVVDNGGAAVRVPVEVGRASANAVEILKGLQAGDQVILSDMSHWNACHRITLD